MAREVQTFSIGGVDYKIAQLGAKKGRKVLVHVMRILAAGAEAEDPVAALSAKLTDEEVDFLCDTFEKTTRVVSDDGKREIELANVFDDHFVGRYGAMVEWLWRCLELNYQSFLGDLERLKGAVEETIQKTSPTMTGKASSASPTPGTGR